MKKKKLKQRIAELEKERDREKFNAQEWEDIYIQCIEELKKHGVKVKITFAEPPIIDASRTEDDKPKYVHGINTAPPTLVFDFSAHDNNIKSKTGRKFF